MKYLFFLLLLSSFIKLAASDNYPKSNKIDVLEYSFSIYLSDSCDLIRGEAIISILHRGKGSEINLDLVDVDKNRKGMMVEKVIADGRPVFWEHKTNRLFIKLDREKEEGNTTVLVVKYSGIPADGLIISENKFGERTFFSDNWPDRARNWIPCVDHPSDKARVEFKVNAPHYYTVVSNGRLIEETDVNSGRKTTYWKEDISIPTKVMVIGVARFASQLVGTVKGVDVWTYVFPENKEKGFSDYAIATEPLRFYSGVIGEYPYKKLANIQSKTIFGGMENASCIFYSERTVSGKNRMESLMAHEIAHQWFGNSVTELDWHHIWLSEGFATYFTSCYMEDRYGSSIMEGLMKGSRYRVIRAFENAPLPVIDTTVSNFMKLLNTNSYQKGSWVLHMLRHELGDRVFFSGIRRYYERYRNENVLTDDFRVIMEEVSKRDLAKFFDQWLVQPSLPVLAVKWDYSARNKESTITVSQEQVEYIFDIPLEIEIIDGRRTRTEKIRVNEKQKSIIIKTRRSPDKVKLDPGIKLLFIEAEKGQS
jgi:aminopeptidase N